MCESVKRFSEVESIVAWLVFSSSKCQGDKRLYDPRRGLCKREFGFSWNWMKWAESVVLLPPGGWVVSCSTSKVMVSSSFSPCQFLLWSVTELESAASTEGHLKMKILLSSMKQLVFCPWYVPMFVLSVEPRSTSGSLSCIFFPSRFLQICAI